MVDHKHSSSFKSYFDKHHIDELINDIIESLTINEPTHPISFLIDFLSDKIKQRGYKHLHGNHKNNECHPPSPSITKNLAMSIISSNLHCDKISYLVREFSSELNEPFILTTKRLSLGSDNFFKLKNSPRRSSQPNFISSPTPTHIYAKLYPNKINTNFPSLEILINPETNSLNLSLYNLVGWAGSIFSQWPEACDGVDMTILAKFIYDISNQYNYSNPYHNLHHAYCVLAMTGHLILTATSSFCSPLEQFSILVAAFCHDVGHPGSNNDFFIKSNHPIAIRYNDLSVLENMHCSLSFETYNTSSFFSSDSNESFTIFRRIFISAVMNTDMKVHFDLVQRMNESSINKDDNNNNKYNLFPSIPEHRKLIHDVLVHASDLGNPLLPWETCKSWAIRVSTEFKNQYNTERIKNIPSAPFMNVDFNNIEEVAKLQAGFIQFVVSPMWTILSEIFPPLVYYQIRMKENEKSWKDLADGL